MDTTFKIASKISFLNQARWSKRPLLVICTVLKKISFKIEDLCPVLDCSRNENLTNVFICLRVGTLNRLSSTLDQRLRIFSVLMLHFFYPPRTSREIWVRTTTSFKLAIEIFLIRKTLISDHFDKLAFSLNKKCTDDVIFSHADTLVGCPFDASIIQFRAYRRVICCYPPRMSRNLSGDEYGLHVVDEVFLSYVPGIHVVVFTRYSSVARALASKPICCRYCNALKGPIQALTREP